MRGYNYYRLKQVDLDGTDTYSNVVALFNKDHAAECTVRTLDPDGLYSLACLVPDDAYLELFSSAGQPLRQQRFSAGGVLDVDIRSLASGVYFARVVDGDQVKSYKLLRP